MRLGYYYHSEVGLHLNSLSMQYSSAINIEALASRVDTLYIIGHSSNEHQGKNLDCRNIEFIDLGQKRNSFMRTFFIRKTISRLNDYIGLLDAIIVRTPTPLIFAFNSLYSF